MAEEHPADATLNALSGTQDSGTGLAYPTTNAADWHTAVFKALEHLNRVAEAANALRVYKDDSAALKFGVRAGKYFNAGTLVSYAGATNQAVTANNTNYIYLLADGTLTVSTSAFPAATTPHVRLAEIVAGAADFDVADLTDRRDASMYQVADAQDALAKHPVRLAGDCRNADGTVLDATGAAGNFKLVAGGWGSGTLLAQGENANGNTKTDTLLFEAVLPPEYVADADVKIVVHAQHDDSSGGTVGTQTIDVEAYKLDDEGAVGADLCATAAGTLANAFADHEFTITDTGLAAGDRLCVLVRTVLQETAGGGNLYAQIGSIELQCDRRH